MNDQSDSTLNNGSYKRNVTYLGLNDLHREYTFLQDPISSKVQVKVDATKSSRISSINVINSGIDYKVGEQINFNEPSIDVEIEQVIGQNIVSIGTSEVVLKNTIFLLKNIYISAKKINFSEKKTL